jgi:thiol-disulfide isomerase/thioredoxin
MKILMTIFTLLLVSMSSLQAQTDAPSNAKVIIVVSTAKWCPPCKKHGARVEKEVVSQFASNEQFAIVVNDLSDANSIKNAAPAIEAKGLTELLAKNKTTGVLYLVDANTKKIISKVSVKESSEELTKAIQSSLSKI